MSESPVAEGLDGAVAREQQNEPRESHMRGYPVKRLSLGSFFTDFLRVGRAENAMAKTYIPSVPSTVVADDNRR